MQAQPTSPSQAAAPDEAPDKAAAAAAPDVRAASSAEGVLTDGKPETADEKVDAMTNAVQQVSISDGSAASSSRQLTKQEMIDEALDCPCIAGMRDGPCGPSFIQAYSCFLGSDTEPKGMDCMAQFKSMQTCIAEHPDEYNLDEEEEGGEEGGEGEQPHQKDDVDTSLHSSSNHASS